ncbi:WHG domain-containing protein, partial [Staphylococcus aureus]|uniref:WHG domain-containing protein n=1 Tax=Staphylococcus aureus TaxID=1280 RepID=UPI001C109AC3
VPYIVAQVAGAFGGAVLTWILYSTLFTQFETVHHMVRGSLESLQLASIFSTYPAPELSIWHAALVEVDRSDPVGRMVALGRAVRAWGLAEPATYALLFGSPVPGYEAPAEQTTGPGTRVVVRL